MRRQGRQDPGQRRAASAGQRASGRGPHRGIAVAEPIGKRRGGTAGGEPAGQLRGARADPGIGIGETSVEHGDAPRIGELLQRRKGLQADVGLRRFGGARERRNRGWILQTFERLDGHPYDGSAGLGLGDCPRQCVRGTAIANLPKQRRGQHGARRRAVGHLARERLDGCPARVKEAQLGLLRNRGSAERRDQCGDGGGRRDLAQGEVGVPGELVERSVPRKSDQHRERRAHSHGR